MFSQRLISDSGRRETVCCRHKNLTKSDMARTQDTKVQRRLFCVTVTEGSCGYQGE